MRNAFAVSLSLFGLTLRFALTYRVAQPARRTYSPIEWIDQVTS